MRILHIDMENLSTKAMGMTIVYKTMQGELKIYQPRFITSNQVQLDHNDVYRTKNKIS